jgi:hypothetical protein
MPAIEHLAVAAGRAAPVGPTGAVMLEFRDAGKISIQTRFIQARLSRLMIDFAGRID